MFEPELLKLWDFFSLQGLNNFKLFIWGLIDNTVGRAANQDSIFSTSYSPT